jgi:hypothetical protein
MVAICWRMLSVLKYIDTSSETRRHHEILI